MERPTDRRESGIHNIGSDRKHQTASDQHGHQVEHGTWRCVCGIELRNVREMVEIKPKSRIPACAAASKLPHPPGRLQVLGVPAIVNSDAKSLGFEHGQETNACPVWTCARRGSSEQPKLTIQMVEKYKYKYKNDFVPSKPRASMHTAGRSEFWWSRHRPPWRRPT